MGPWDAPCEAHRSTLARASCKPGRKPIMRQYRQRVRVIWQEIWGIPWKTRDTGTWMSLSTHLFSWVTAVAVGEEIPASACACLVDTRREHVWRNCLPVYIGLGITGGGFLGSKVYKSNYVSLCVTLSALRLIPARQSALTKYKLASMLQTAYRIINDKTGANCAATPHMLYGQPV